MLIAIGVVTSAVYATGAFSGLMISRNANVHVAGDKAGYLGLQPGANGQYTTYRNGKLQLQLNGALEGEGAPRGQGVNHDAETSINSVFTVTNQGTQSVGVWLADTSDQIAFQRDSGDSLEGQGNAVTLTPGESVAVGLAIDTTDADVDELDTTLTINADSEIKGRTSRANNRRAPEDTSTEQVNEESSSDKTKDSSNTGNSNDGKYEKCGLFDVNCHKRNTGTFVDEKSKDVGKWVDDKIKTADERRDKLVQKFTSNIETVIKFLGNHPKIATVLSPLGLPFSVWAKKHPDQATSFVLGILLGEGGMPGGIAEVSNKYTKSLFYTVGWIAPGFIPEIGAVFDGRDLTNSILTLNAEGIVLNSIGLASSVKGTGPGDVAKAAWGLSEWITKVGGKAGSAAEKTAQATVLKGIGKFIIPSMPDKVRHFGVKLMDRVSDGTVSKLRDNGASVDQIVYFSKKCKLNQAAKASKKGGLPVLRTTYKTNLGLWETLRLAKAGHRPKAVGSLIENGLLPKEVQKYAWVKGVNLNKAEELRKSKGVNIYNIQSLVDKGANFKKAKTAHDMDVPIEHIEYYAKNSNNLDYIIAARKKGFSDTFIKKVYDVRNSDKIKIDKIKNKSKEINWKKKGKTGARAAGGISPFYIVAHNYCR